MKLSKCCHYKAHYVFDTYLCTKCNQPCDTIYKARLVKDYFNAARSPSKIKKLISETHRI
jgi:hypothetical protein